ncbi:hypothetical protein ACVOMV_17355 [Mesorhizobium atlanticum]
MATDQTLSQRFDTYQPSKTLWFWSVVGAAILTMIIGLHGRWLDDGGNGGGDGEDVRHKGQS